jgi:rare lipoprotein A
VNDRGPFKRGRSLDVSKEAARQLGFLRDGTTQVEVRVLSLP